MPRGRMLRVRRLLRGIFDKETRRKAVAVVGAAMELRARLGIGKAPRSVALPSGKRCKARWSLVEGPILRFECGWRWESESLFSR
jgi:hypothetical protein